MVVALDAVADKLIAEWRLEAMFTRPVLLDDRVLIEPTGAVAHLTGASIAEFRGRRIRAFRHYFDDSELLADAAGPVAPALLRVVLTPAAGRRSMPAGSPHAAIVSSATGTREARHDQLARSPRPDRFGRGCAASEDSRRSRSRPATCRATFLPGLGMTGVSLRWRGS